jgi:DNA repair protein RAD50
MSSLERLAISGVRSFDPNHSAVIDFFTPLTLIVGHNGSGKTTIIECLKYATTGDLPPGSKTGGSFIHDPKIAHVNEVKAKIKLKFRNTKGKEMVATRSIQASMKKAKLEQRQLEGTLASVDPQTGEVRILTVLICDLTFIKI